MRGFLDPAHQVHPKSYSSVIDRLIVALDPQQAYGFGSSVQPIGTSLGTLGNRDFYSDNNTEMEDVLERVAADSQATTTHLIIGDGRRSDPNAANAQYVQMRDLARRWIGQGGTFLVAASRAPFEYVPGDPAGCRVAGDSTSSGCPLYAFAFIAPGDEARTVGRFAAADAFEHLFVWPLPAASPTRVVMESQSPDIIFEPAWAATDDQIPIARVRGQGFTNVPLLGRLELAGAADPPSQAARAALEGQELRSEVRVRPLRPEAKDAAWANVGSAGSLVRAAPERPGAVEFLSRGSTADRYLYKVERYPTGEVPWLEDFDASSADDAVRTYGLGRLFELFRSEARSGETKPVQRAYVVVN